MTTVRCARGHPLHSAQQGLGKLVLWFCCCHDNLKLLWCVCVCAYVAVNVRLGRRGRDGSTEEGERGGSAGGQKAAGESRPLHYWGGWVRHRLMAPEAQPGRLPVWCGCRLTFRISCWSLTGFSGRWRKSWTVSDRLEDSTSHPSVQFDRGAEVHRQRTEVVSRLRRV